MGIQKKITFWEKLKGIIEALEYSPIEHQSKLLYQKSVELNELELRVKKLENRIEEGCTFLAYSIDFFFLGDSARIGMNTIMEGLK